MLKSDANDRLTLRGRVYARHRSSGDSSDVFRMSWQAVLLAVVLSAVMIAMAVIAQWAGTQGNLGLVMGLGVSMTGVLFGTYFLPLFFVRRAELFDESNCPPRPSSNWILVRVGVRVDGDGCGALGWLSVDGGWLKFRSHRFDFDLSKDDWKSARMVDNHAVLYIPKDGPVTSMRIRLVPFEVRDGRMHQSRDLAKWLLKQLETMPVRKGESVYPPIELPEAKLGKAKLIKGFLAGCLIGGLMTAAALAGPRPSKEPWWIVALIMTLSTCTISMLMTSVTYLSFRSRAKQIEKWSRS